MTPETNPFTVVDFASKNMLSGCLESTSEDLVKNFAAAGSEADRWLRIEQRFSIKFPLFWSPAYLPCLVLLVLALPQELPQ
jgi:hypothetical protein